ncbi:hypothetical protein Tco_1214287 [Tanacetum coccineum]
MQRETNYTNCCSSVIKWQSQTNVQVSLKAFLAVHAPFDLARTINQSLEDDYEPLDHSLGFTWIASVAIRCEALKRHNVFFRRKGIKVSTRYSWANLKDIPEDFQGKFESFLLVNLESVEGVMLVHRIPELMHVHFRDIRSDEKCRVAWSECNSIQNDLKCGFSWSQSARDSSIAFFDIKSILFGNKLKIKLGLLSGDGRHDSAKICHIQFIYK